MIENATTIERILLYVEQDRHKEAKALAQLADYLESCFEWDIEWNVNL